MRTSSSSSCRLPAEELNTLRNDEQLDIQGRQHVFRKSLTNNGPVGHLRQVRDLTAQG